MFIRIGVFDLQCVTGVPQCVETEGLIVNRAFVPARGDIFVVTITQIISRCTELDGKVIGHTEVQNAVIPIVAVITVTHPNLAAEFTRRPGSLDTNGAADSVATEQGALGSPEHFYRCQINAAQNRATVGTDKQAVDLNTDSRIEVFLHVCHTDAADIQCRVAARTLRGIVKNQIWRDKCEVSDVARKGTIDFRLGQSAHRQTYVLEVFGPLSRADNDFLQHQRPLLCHRDRRTRQRRQSGQYCSADNSLS